MKVRLSAFLISIGIIISSLLSVSGKYFTDVPSLGWERDVINYSTDNGYIDGTSSDKFEKEASFSRANAATMLYRLEKSPSVTVSAVFNDVSSSASYAKAVFWAYNEGIMNGTSATTFEPDTAIRRQDLMVILYKYSSLKEYNITRSSEISAMAGYNKVSQYALDAMEWAVGSGLIDKSDDLNPRTVVTRLQAAEFLSEFSIRIEGILNERDNFSSDSYRVYSNSGRYISADDYATLKYYINIYSKTPETDLSSVAELKSSAYTPNFGMAVCVLLNKLGKLNLSSNFDKSNAKSVYDIAVSQNKQLASVINFYDLTQAISGVLRNKINIEVVCAHKVYAQLADYGISLFKYDYIINDIEYTDVALAYNLVENSDGTFIADVYMPSVGDAYHVTLRFPSNKVYMDMYFDEIGYDRVTAVQIFENDSATNVWEFYEVFDKYDLDSYYNNVSAIPVTADEEDKICNSSSEIINDDTVGIPFANGALTRKELLN